MVEALIAFVLAVLLLAVFKAPSWLIRLGEFGGLGFVLWVVILVIEWVFGKIRS